VGGLAKAKLALLGGTLERGGNDLVLNFQPISSMESASLSQVVAVMPTHGHSSTPEGIVATAAGFRIVQLPLFMSGAWRIRCDFSVGDSSDSVAFDVDVP